MTKSTAFEKRASITLTPGNLCFGFLGVFCLLLLLRNASIAVESMERGLLLCAKTIIPSLFPFMVISEMIVSGGVFSVWIKRISKPLQKILRISEDGCCAVILGMLCGFPIGAKCTALAYQQGKIDHDEASRVLAFSNNPSSAFLITAVGGTLWKSTKLGTAFYLTSLTSLVIIGFLLAQIPKRKSAIPFRELSLARPAQKSSVSIFCDAIRSSLASVLTVCAYVVFFSAFLGALSHLPVITSLSPAAKAVLFCLFELSNGAEYAATVPSTLLGVCITAFAIGWSGLSVHCQILSVCEGSGISMRPYFFAKLLQSLLCPVLLGILLALCPAILTP